MQGTVLLHVDVDSTGKVTHVDVVGGPEMLRSAALQAANQYTYSPFLDAGIVHPARLVVSVPFSLGIPDSTYKSDQEIARAYFPKSDLCRAAIAGQHWPEALTQCKDLAEIAERFPDPKSRANEIRGAYQDYGTALFDAGDPQSALIPLHKALAVAQTSLTESDAEYASVFFSQALAEHALKQYDLAEKDYTTAQDSYRNAIVSLPEMTKQYSYSLSRALAFHAVLESQTDHPEEMKKLATEALELNPKAFQGIAEDPK